MAGRNSKSPSRNWRRRNRFTGRSENLGRERTQRTQRTQRGGEILCVLCVLSRLNFPMDDTVPFGSREYLLMLVLLVFARGMDFLSTWIATPNLVLEGNPIAKKLGWRGGVIVNAIICAVFALWPLPAIVIITTSLLVAARNFQSAWLMRSLGEVSYSCR